MPIKAKENRMAFGISKSWLDGQDEAQAEIVRDMEDLRRYCKTATDHEAIDLVIDQAKEIRSKIAWRRMRTAMLKG
jgi:hypothetical protein